MIWSLNADAGSGYQFVKAMKGSCTALPTIDGCKADPPSNPPSNPSTPSNPDSPSNPDTPSNPSNPETPNNPDNTGNPDNPDTPSNPDSPSNGMSKVMIVVIVLGVLFSLVGAVGLYYVYGSKSKRKKEAPSEESAVQDEAR